jgi:hypothetical protein
VAAQFEHVAAESDLAPAQPIATRIPARRDVPSAPLTAQTAAEQP